jgi:5-hydroxyisourate hydrolase
MSRITTHVLDLTHGCPASGLHVTVWRLGEAGDWREVGEGVTDRDGRIGDLARSVEPGTCRLRFDTGAYFQERDVPFFYPRVEVTITVSEANGHYHVPLLLSPFGYSTYRGS